ncbi:hypothetical protein L1987_45239 [Smallanthus sonchifolius]|uniref:Uncharacterized protein n=1 Tax=Smallanthus sonchifolius TaxID=185202 RepID=A0ACB9GRP9_9ASTR|nr:hypothetical protein L1987_45239 [Smallanthus sonchifolius]
MEIQLIKKMKPLENEKGSRNLPVKVLPLLAKPRNTEVSNCTKSEVKGLSLPFQQLGGAYVKTKGISLHHKTLIGLNADLTLAYSHGCAGGHARTLSSLEVPSSHS